MINKFQPEKFHIDLEDIARGAKKLIWNAGQAIGAAYVYWVNPGLYYAAAGLGIPKAHDVRDVTGKIIDVWKQHTGWTFGLLCVGSFLSLPSTIFAATFIVGSYTGSELSIQAAARKAVTIYEERISKKEEFTDGYKEALTEFLCADRNLLVYNSLWDHTTKIKIIHETKDDKTVKLFGDIFHNISNANNQFMEETDSRVLDVVHDLNEDDSSHLDEEIRAAKKDLYDLKRYLWEKKFPYPKTIDSLLVNLANNLFPNVGKTG